MLMRENPAHADALIMRWIIDGLIVLMLTTLLAGTGMAWQQSRLKQRQADEVRHALRQLRDVAFTHAAIDPELRHDQLYPQKLQPQWFAYDPPHNSVVGPSHPWLDVAPEGDMAWHPPDPVVDHSDQAGFWYNPNRGIFRARVPRQFTEQQTLALYNDLNEAGLRVLPEGVADPLRHAEPAARLSEIAPEPEISLPQTSRPTLRDSH